MIALREYYNESKNEDPFENFDTTSGVLCPIHIFIKHIQNHTPYRGYNFDEYVRSNEFNKFIEWAEKEWPAALQSDHEDELFAIVGTMYEDSSKPSLDIYKLENALEKKLGKLTGGGGVKASCFGPIGIGTKYFYSYYFGQAKGALLTCGAGSDRLGSRQINWALFIDNDTINEFGLK